jgi:hypothetical protein
LKFFKPFADGRRNIAHGCVENSVRRQAALQARPSCARA